MTTIDSIKQELKRRADDYNSFSYLTPTEKTILKSDRALLTAIEGLEKLEKICAHRSSTEPFVIREALQTICEQWDSPQPQSLPD